MGFLHYKKYTKSTVILLILLFDKEREELLLKCPYPCLPVVLSYPALRSSMGFVSVCAPLKYLPGDGGSISPSWSSFYPCFLSVSASSLSISPSITLSFLLQQRSRMKLRHFDIEVGSKTALSNIRIGAAHHLT